MTELLNRLRSVAHFTRKSVSPPPSPRVAAPAAAFGDPLGKGLFEYLSNMAASRPPKTDFDPQAMAMALRKRIHGLELNFSKLTPQEEALFREFSLDDWRGLRAVAARGQSRGIAYVELDAQDFETLLPALRDAFSLECVSIRLPHGVNAIDVNNLRNGGGPRVNFIRPEDEAPEPLPCVGDEILVKALREVLGSAKDRPNDIDGLINAMLSCAAFDAGGEFGFDFSRLPRKEARALQGLPAAGWNALQASAKRAGSGIGWLVIPDKVVLSKIVPNLKKLVLLGRLSVPAPGGVPVIDVSGLPGGGLLLRELVVRNPDTLLEIHLPLSVRSVRAEGGTDDWQLSKMMYMDADGMIQRTTCDWKSLVPTYV